VERAVTRRVEATERLLNLLLFEQEVARRQIRGLNEEVRGLREAVLFEQKSVTVAGCCGSNHMNHGWVDVDE
jgi:hypothetical protein